MIRAIVLTACGLALTGCAGIYGAKGNDTGGIIPWSQEAEAMALITANNNCNIFGKRAVITSVRRVPGDFIAYECRFDRPLERRST